MTSKALWGYILGLPFLSGASLAARVFFSCGDTKTPAKVAAISLGFGVLIALTLIWPLKHVGLALASSLASVINFTWLILLLRKQGEIKLSPFLKDGILSLIMAFLMGALLWPLYHVTFFAQWNGLLKVSLGLLVGISVYFGMAYICRSGNIKPLKELWEKMVSKLKRQKS
jgi:putative peptidoglycan lipid II flippase